MSRFSLSAPLEHFIFWSRWLQAPLYLGLIIAQGVYVIQFMVQLFHLIMVIPKLFVTTTGHVGAERSIGVGVDSGMVIDAHGQLPAFNPEALVSVNAGGHLMSYDAETAIILLVLGLIDVVMISNLLIMVIIGGYQTFISKLEVASQHPDRPDWLSHINAGVMKIKLGTALIGISSIHLLINFINARETDTKVLIAQASIHVIFLFSAIMLAWTDRIMMGTLNVEHQVNAKNAKHHHLSD